MRRSFLALLLALGAFVVRAEDAVIARLFAEAGVSGTLVLESLAGRERIVHDEARARRPLAPASTFKVLHTLIGLEEGAVTDAGSAFAWDGTRHDIVDWNGDQTLRSAFRISCVWCYQEIARRVGAARYPARLREAGYGNLREPFAPTEFWLDGALTISADGQVDFLRRLVTRSLPYRAVSYETLKTIMLAEETPAWRLYAKTGWAARTAPGIGWYVGYVETAGDTWLFALNIDTRVAADLPLRQRLLKAALRERLGLEKSALAGR